MSDLDFTSDPRDCGSDVGAYVLGALERGEAEAFRRHIADCVVCRDEVATLQAVADSLSTSPSHLGATKGLRRRVLALGAAESKAIPSADRPRRVRLRLPRPALIRSLPFGQGRTLLAGGLLAAAVSVGVLELGSGGASSVRSVPAAVIDQGDFAHAVLNLGGGHAELLVSGMQPPPSGMIYEVWLDRPGQAPQATSSLFSVTSAGAGVVDIPGSLRGVSEVMVTPEPLGGSRVPTHAPVLVAALTS